MRARRCLLFVCSVLVLCGAAAAQVPSPASVLGHNPGDDYYLANYEEEIHYFRVLAEHSDRIRMLTAGKSTEGRDIEFAVISSPENLAQLDHYKEIARTLATADGLNDAEAQALTRTSKVIVHIDGGLHSNEVAGPQHAIALAYKLTSAQNDPEVDNILNNVILLLWPTLNPDGQDMVVSWYRKNLGTRYEVSPLPWLFQDYVGHDNNRDGYMLNMKESQVVTRTELEYSPAIFYCQHQTAPFPALIWTPPFSDPISTNISPYVKSWFNVIGTNMTAYLDAHHMPGAASESRFDNWYPGFVDYAGSFRNEISFFTETALYRYATPRFYAADELPKDSPALKPVTLSSRPWSGGWWRLRDAVNYMVEASMSVLGTAALDREMLLYNRYEAARDNIRHYQQEPPFAYVIPSVQADAPEGELLAHTLQENGIQIEESRAGFHANGRDYPAGSWVIRMDQPYSSLARELFEVQRYPTAPSTDNYNPAHLPYDVTGWTLPLQMGVQVDAVAAPLTREEVADLKPVLTLDPPPAEISGSGGVFIMSHEPNNSFRAVNDLLAQGASVAFAQDETRTPEGMERGAIVVTGMSRTAMDDLSKKYAISVLAMERAPEHTLPLYRARVGLYRPWDASIDEGWTRWILEQYGYAPVSLYNADMRAGRLKNRVDVLILPDMQPNQLMDGRPEGTVPEEYAGGLGYAGLRQIRNFVRQGGTLIAFNQTAATLASLLSLPVENVLDGVRRDTFFCSGALLRVQLESTDRPVTWGLPVGPVVMFERGPAFATQTGFRGAVLARYPQNSNPLASGLLQHPEAIENKIAALEVPYGRGHIYLYGFKPQWRGQSHGTYKFFFNVLYKYQEPPFPKPAPAEVEEVRTGRRPAQRAIGPTSAR